MNRTEETYKQSALLMKQARHAWNAMRDTREKRERNKKFTYGDQWSDYMLDENGNRVREYDYLKETGKEPLTNNLIRQLVKSVVGRFRQQAAGRSSQPHMAEIRTGNCLDELDSRAMEEFLISGCSFQKIEKSAGRPAVAIRNISPAMMLVNPFSDPRGLDCDLIGEIHETTLAEIVKRLADGNREKAVHICHIYENADNVDDFTTPRREGRVRIVELWKKESREGFDCHNRRRGEWYFQPFPASDADADIERRWCIRDAWRCYWIAPDGSIVSAYDSPYAHRSHPYAFKLYPLTDGEVHSLVEDVIDQQKYVNRLITLVDHIMGTSAKGVLLYPDTMLPDGYTWDDLRYAWAKPSAIVPYHPRGGTDRPQQISTNATDIGAYEMVNLQMRLFEQISGVSGALQGQSAGATTGVALYESQIANSTVALSDIFESFESFLLQRDAKALTT